MIREFRYIVHKLKDTQAALTTAERDELDRIGMKIEAWRKTVGKRPMRCVVVESDWPEYEPTWAAIEQRMTGRALPSLAELERDAARWRWLDAQTDNTWDILSRKSITETREYIDNAIARAKEAKPRINANGAREDCPRCHGESAFAKPGGGWQLCSCTYRVDKEGKPT